MPLKCWRLLSGQHRVISLKTTVDIFTAVETSRHMHEYLEARSNAVKRHFVLYLKDWRHIGEQNYQIFMLNNVHLLS
jgi:hypothetical protein